MPDLKRFAFISGVLFLISLSIQSQSNISTSREFIKSTTEYLLGTDDLLVNGMKYYPEYAYVTGSPEFEYPAPHKSVLYIKGRKFEGMRLAYDIVSDQVLLVQESGNGFENRIQLHNAFVDSFRISDHLFISPSNYLNDFTGKGFYEKVSGGNTQFLRKYKKDYLRIYDNSNRGKYSPQQFSSYLMNRKGLITPLTGTASLIRYFRPHRKSIRQYLGKNKISLKRSGNGEISNLMDFCNSLSDEAL